MKSGEFDALVRQKFDENDFEFNPKSWDKLVEQMDDRPKKRNMLIWWAMPVAGMAASVALAMGAASLVKYGMPATAGAGSNAVAHHKTAQPKHAQHQAVAYTATTVTELQAEAQTAPISKASSKNEDAQNVADDNNNNGFNSRLLAAIAHNTPGLTPVKDTREVVAKTNDAATARKKPVTINEWNMANVTEEDMTKASGLSVTLSGGINYGDRNNGFSAGASVRKMINSRVYVEGDVAFINSANRQLFEYQAYEPATSTASTTPSVPAGIASAAKTTTGMTAEEISKAKTSTPLDLVSKQEDHLYSMQYAQVTPSIGYKIADRISIGAGPDFQQALADKRPALPTDNRENQRVAPLFDIGLMGKTEINLAKRLKAAVYYRKGINNVITPMNKYVDRDYLQFQIKCTVFDK